MDRQVTDLLAGNTSPGSHRIASPVPVTITTCTYTILQCFGIFLHCRLVRGVDVHGGHRLRKESYMNLFVHVVDIPTLGNDTKFDAELSDACYIQSLNVHDRHKHG